MKKFYVIYCQRSWGSDSYNNSEKTNKLKNQSDKKNKNILFRNWASDRYDNLEYAIESKKKFELDDRFLDTKFYILESVDFENS